MNFAESLKKRKMIFFKNERIFVFMGHNPVKYSICIIGNTIHIKKGEKNSLKSRFTAENKDVYYADLCSKEISDIIRKYGTNITLSLNL